MRRSVWVLGLAMMACTSPRVPPPDGMVHADPARFPRDAARFEVRPLTDSTVAFEPAEAAWVRPGMRGIVVDPARGDALVARLRVETINGETAVAFVTGQTTRVAAGNVMLLVPPSSPWWRQRTFWWGTLAGVVVTGAVVAFL